MKLALLLLMGSAQAAPHHLPSACVIALGECAAERDCAICVTAAWPAARSACGVDQLGATLEARCNLTVGHHSNAPGQVGLFKSTWAASDPLHTTLPALLRYLPVVNTANSCPNNTCTCGATGRTQMVGATFGLHTVLAAGKDGCRASVPLTGERTLGELEVPLGRISTS